jgi:hypothetical protein
MKSLLLFLFCAVGLFSDVTDFQKLMGKDSPVWVHVSRTEDVLALEKFENFYENNKVFLNGRSSDYTIPPILHVIHLSDLPLNEAFLKRWISFHAGWKVKLWTLKEVAVQVEGVDVMDANRFPFLYSRQEFEGAKSLEEKGDILRFEILYQEGGLCIEMGTKCLKSFDPLNRGLDFYCGLNPPHPPIAGKNITSGHEILGARPFHPVIGKSLELVRERGVMQETSWILTEALVDRLGEDGNVDIVLPASYFFAKEGMTPLFAQCPFFQERLITKSVKTKLKAVHWYLLGGIFLAFAGSFLYIFRVRRRKS